MVRDQECQRALTERRTLGGRGVLERGHSAPLEPLAQLGDTLSFVDAVAPLVEATELVHCQAAKGAEGQCQRALTQKRTLRAAAHLRLEIFVSLRTAASAEAPSAPMSLSQRLQEMGGGSERAQACVSGR